MKRNILFLLFSLLLIISCGKENSSLETFNPEAFAYDLGDSWEVNAIVNVKGFEQRENIEDEKFEASISYSADIKTPEGAIKENLFSDKTDFSSSEIILDIPLEIQFELGPAYTLGKYQIIYTIKDNFSGGIITGTVEFDLSE
jgi:hypothetical protein